MKYVGSYFSLFPFFFCIWCRRCAAHFAAAGVFAAFHTADRVDAALFSAVSVGVMLPILLRLTYVLPFALLLGYMLPLSCSWCRRYATRFTAVGVRAVLYTAARVDAAFFSGFWWMLPPFIGVDADFIYCR